MHTQLRTKFVVLVISFTAAVTAAAGTLNVCQVTSQAGLNSCKNSAQGDYANALGVCANITDSQSQQACVQRAKSDLQSAESSCQEQFTERNHICQKLGGEAYDPVIDPANFSTTINNPLFPMKPGTTYIYEGPTSQGFIRNTVEVTANTKLIDGVTTIEVHDQVFTDGALTEDTLDWYAQDKDGSLNNVDQSIDRVFALLERTQPLVAGESWRRYASNHGAQYVPGLLSRSRF